MSDALLITAGILGALIAVVHGAIGHARLIRPLPDRPGVSKRLLGAIMALSAVYWLAAGAALISAPFWAGPQARMVVVVVAAGFYATGALGNAWATRGRHFGWPLLALATGLTLAGA